MKDYKLSTKASEELEDIWHFIARDDPLAANMFIQQFLDTFKLLVVSPRMGRMRPELLSLAHCLGDPLNEFVIHGERHCRRRCRSHTTG
jgi:toxin ParE1/3/4